MEMEDKEETLSKFANHLKVFPKRLPKIYTKFILISKNGF